MYTLNDAPLECVTEEKDLGVLVDYKLSWEKHVNSVVAKANKLLGLLKRTCPMLTNLSVRLTNSIPIACEITIMFRNSGLVA